jgi:hypothetical protein
MKIATFNINNINRRLPNLLLWLKQAKPDIVALQELKSADGDFPQGPIDKAGYGAVWRGQKTWNGVAILARNADPVLIRNTLPGDSNDDEARYIEAAIRGIVVTSLYLPNGNPQPGPKFDTKLDWFRRLRTHAAKLLQRRPDYPRYLSDKILGHGCVDPAKEPRRIPGLDETRLDGCDPHASPFKTDVHVLGLQAQPLASRRRLAARSSPAQPCARAAPEESGRRPPGARRGRRQRPRAGLDYRQLGRGLISA